MPLDYHRYNVVNPQRHSISRSFGIEIQDDEIVLTERITMRWLGEDIIYDMGERERRANAKEPRNVDRSKIPLGYSDYS